MRVFDHRNARHGTDAFDQALAAARNDDVDGFRHCDHQVDGGTVGGGDHLHCVRRQPGPVEPAPDAVGNRLVRVKCLRATSQQWRCRPEAQGGGIGGHVRPRFIDDPDHAERHAHAPDLDTAGAELHIEDLTDRVGQRDDLAQAVDHAVDTGMVEFEAVEQCGIQPLARPASRSRRLAFDQVLRCASRSSAIPCSAAFLAPVSAAANAREAVRARRPRSRIYVDTSSICRELAAWLMSVPVNR